MLTIDEEIDYAESFEGIFSHEEFERRYAPDIQLFEAAAFQIIERIESKCFSHKVYTGIELPDELVWLYNDKNQLSRMFLSYIACYQNSFPNLNVLWVYGPTSQSRNMRFSEIKYAISSWDDTHHKGMEKYSADYNNKRAFFLKNVARHSYGFISKELKKKKKRSEFLTDDIEDIETLSTNGIYLGRESGVIKLIHDYAISGLKLSYDDPALVFLRQLLRNNHYFASKGALALADMYESAFSKFYPRDDIHLKEIERIDFNTSKYFSAVYLFSNLYECVRRRSKFHEFLKGCYSPDNSELGLIMTLVENMDYNKVDAGMFCVWMDSLEKDFKLPYRLTEKVYDMIVKEDRRDLLDRFLVNNVDSRVTKDMMEHDFTI